MTWKERSKKVQKHSETMTETATEKNLDKVDRNGDRNWHISGNRNNTNMAT